MFGPRGQRGVLFLPEVILLDYMCIKDETDAAKKMAYWEKGARVKVYGGGECYGQFSYNLITRRGTLFVHAPY